MENERDIISRRNHMWNDLPEGHEFPTEQSKEQFAREILMRLITRIRADYNGGGAKLAIQEELRQLDDL